MLDYKTRKKQTKVSESFVEYPRTSAFMASAVDRDVPLIIQSGLAKPRPVIPINLSALIDWNGDNWADEKPVQIPSVHSREFSV